MTTASSEGPMYKELQPPLPQDNYPMTMPSGGAVFYNHPVLPPAMMTMATDMEDDNAAISITSCTESTTFRLEISHIQTKNSRKQETISKIFPFFAIDVECVATGNGTNDRDVARIAVPIVSYLTQLTGIIESNLADAPGLEEALVRLKDILLVESVIVGQSIKKDLEWLMLEKPTDYKGEFDVADLFRLPMQSTNGVVRYRYFSLRHVAKYLLGHEIQEADHDPVIDARYAMKVFKGFRYLHENPGRRDAVLQTLLKTPRTPSFADRYPVIDGVLMRAPRKQSTSPSIRNGNRVAAESVQQGTNESYMQQPGQQPLFL
ncbi:unnamed protein product [Peronospora destructor]|uniref:Exonuclease domain-containing protein n=1 Tax=Peronospora destructor TaxID=86335 RepID=A0AAV0UZE2_9STRA|nr:unnamed protein product [Peronospora destructor]